MTVNTFIAKWRALGASERGNYALSLADPATVLGVRSGRAHVAWALRAGGVLENRPRYNSTRTFQPFPSPTPEQHARITELGEALHVQRKARRALHPALTLTENYNVVEALQEGRALSSKEQQTFDAGAVGVLAEIHADLDRAVADAYGRPEGQSGDEMVTRLALLNAERAAEEARGHVRYLRPAFQNPGASDQTMRDVRAEIEALGLVGTRTATSSPSDNTKP